MLTYLIFLLVLIHPLPKPSYQILNSLLSCESIQVLKIEQKYATWYIKLTGQGAQQCINLFQYASCTQTRHIFHCALFDHQMLDQGSDHP